MKIKLSPNITQKLPGIEYIVILVKNIDNIRKTSNLSQMLRGRAVVAKNELRKAERKDLFNRVAGPIEEDGTTLLESYLLDARMKKVQSSKEIESTNNLLNLMSLISLKFFLPMHGFDMDQAETDYEIDFYMPKKGKKAPELDFIPETRNIAMWFPNLGGWSDEELDSYLAEIDVWLDKYFSTRITDVFSIDVKTAEKDLEYESELEMERKKQLEIEQREKEKKEKSAVLQPTEPKAGIIPDNTEEMSGEKKQSAEDIIKKLLVEAVGTEFPEVKNVEPEGGLFQLIEVEVPKDINNGDLSTNIAMRLSKIVGKKPQKLAAGLVTSIQTSLAKEDHNILEKVENVGPGFINFYLKEEYLKKELESLLLEKEKFGRVNIGKGEKIMIEFGSLNMAKPFGAHHFMTTVIGQTLVNLHKVTGYDVLAGDFPGDWGTQFGKLMYAFKEWGDRETIERDPMKELLNLYVKFHEESEKEPSLEDAARAEFKALENGNEEREKLWKWIVDISTKDLEEIYKTMGVHHDRHYPESKYNRACMEVLERGKKLGVIEKGEKDAYIVRLEEEGLPPALVQKGDGTTLYITRDIASIEERLKNEADLKKLIYVVDVAQTLHFKQLFAMAARMHAADPDFPICEFKHIPYGRMSFSEGGMSTRKGNIILGRELIKEAHDRAEKIVNEKMAANGGEISPVEKKNLVHGIAIGAIKYTMLCQAPESDLVFDWDKVISLDGNSAPYLQYSLARAHSIIRKLDEKPVAATETPTLEKTEAQINMFSLEQEQKHELENRERAAAEEGQRPFGLEIEQELLKQLVQFPEKVAAAAENYKPNILTNYLHQLAQTFNSFYASVPVLKTGREDLRTERIKLVKGTIQVLTNGLQVLGITTFKRM